MKTDDKRICITDIEIRTMWGDTSIIWHGLDPNINIVWAKTASARPLCSTSSRPS